MRAREQNQNETRCVSSCSKLNSFSLSFSLSLSLSPIHAPPPRPGSPRGGRRPRRSEAGLATKELSAPAGSRADARAASTTATVVTPAPRSSASTKMQPLGVEAMGVRAYVRSSWPVSLKMARAAVP